jgi:chromosome segregation ATPase
VRLVLDGLNSEQERTLSQSLTQDAQVQAFTASMDKLEKEHAIQLGTAKDKLSDLEKWTRHALVDLKAFVEKHAAVSDDTHHLRMQHDEFRKIHEPCVAALAARDAQIIGLKVDLAALDQDLTKELERKAVLAKNLAEEQKMKKELNVNLTKALAGKDTEMEILISALRRQIKETKDALELDTPKLLEIKNTVQTETADRQEKLKARVKLGGGAPPIGGALPVPAASGGKNGLEFGAMDLDRDAVLSKAEFKSKLSIMGWSLEEAEQTFKALDRDGDGGISANEYAAFCRMEDKNLEFGTLNGIAKLRQQLADLQAQLAALACKDAEMEDLKKRMAAAEKQIAEEKLKTEELQANLEKTKVCL